MAKGNGGETIIALGVRLEGDMSAEGDLIIEGEVHGNVKTTGDLRVGENAVVQADVEAENAVIAGEIRGNIKIRGKLELFPSSKLTGDVTTEVLAIGPGAQVNGSITMGAPASTGRASRKSEAAEE